ncbi:MAG: response regulator [Myxococcales bacterium]|nr:response regulator [Myxococcales bacterium]MCB9732955.1 response regulator [Deltaproteobacteria bacterium]
MSSDGHPAETPVGVARAAPPRVEIDRTRLVGVAVLAVFGSCASFAGARLLTQLDTGKLTPWWGNALGAVVMGAVWLWFRKRREARSTVALHLSAATAVVALLLPVAYGMGSTIWWLTLVSFSAVLMGSRREALVWAIIVFVAVTAAVLLEPHVQIAGAAGESPVEAAMAKIVFVVVILGIAWGVHRVLSQHTRELAASRAAAERSASAKTRILAHMSHEVRTPLNTIVAMTDLALRSSELPAELRGELRAAHHASRLLMRLIQDVQDASRLDVDDALMVRAEPFLLHRSLTEVLEPLRWQMNEVGLEFTAVAAPELDERRVGDADRVCQVALNLVSNAMKFTPHGSIHVRLAADPDDPDRVCLTVHDTGCGIARADLARVFEPHVQLEGLKSQRAAGAGLGLTITKKLTDRMDGRIDVDSEVGVGTTFRAWMRLPRESPDAPAPGPEQLLVVSEPELAPAVVEMPEEPLAVLVVDDDPINRLVLQRLLGSLGHLATLEGRSVEALAVFAHHPFDLLVTDLDMPEIDGLELTRRVRAMPGGERIPAVAVTAHASLEWRQRALDAGLDGFLTKPFTLDQLASEIGRVMQGRRAMRRPSRVPAYPITTRRRLVQRHASPTGA